MSASRSPATAGSAAALALLALLCASVAQAQDTLPLEPTYHPKNGASTEDPIYALFASNCGRPTLDPARAPDVVITDAAEPIAAQVDITYYVIEPATTDCPAVALPDVLTPVPLGTLPIGTSTLVHHFEARAADATAFRPLDITFSDAVVVGNTPNPSVSGIWFDPATPGTGVVLNLVPDAGAGEPAAMVFIATVGDDGQPVWMSGLGHFVDSVLEVDLTITDANGSAPNTTVDGGTVRFDYGGCGEAQMSYTGLDVDFPPPAPVAVQQLTRTAGLPECGPPTSRPRGSD